MAMTISAKNIVVNIITALHLHELLHNAALTRGTQLASTEGTCKQVTSVSNGLVGAVCGASRTWTRWGQRRVGDAAGGANICLTCIAYIGALFAEERSDDKQKV
ncbi:hypothetical protein [Desulfatirhabdium butyrativorans]|uniref:hypothetical protein n=1 Tax=Desulfatirhabdium butyrativorans TaxID=340467 RepID=UPI000481EB2A|nr:hypothetical protein [Desulfatirhabdium butyrativorans]